MTKDHSNKESLDSIKFNEQRLIKDAQNNSGTTAHLTFDSDNEDNQRKPFVETKMQLFDDQEILNVEEHFQEKTRKPRKKRKLRELERDNDNDAIDHLDIFIEHEKKISSEILDKLTNVKSSSGSKLNAKITRFDSSKTEHRIYELDSEIPINGNSSIPSNDMQPKSILKAVKDVTPIINVTRTYEVDKLKLKSMFDKTSKSTDKIVDQGQFQFQFFNNDQPMSVPVSKLSSRSIPNENSKIFWKQPDDSFRHEHQRETTYLADEDELDEPMTKKTFFFFDIDDRLKDGLDRFVRTEELSELERSWPMKRKEIGEALRAKHRKAVQRNDKHRIFNHRRRQQQHSSYNLHSKSDMD